MSLQGLVSLNSKQFTYQRNLLERPVLNPYIRDSIRANHLIQEEREEGSLTHLTLEYEPGACKPWPSPFINMCPLYRGWASSYLTYPEYGSWDKDIKVAPVPPSLRPVVGSFQLGFGVQHGYFPGAGVCCLLCTGLKERGGRRGTYGLSPGTLVQPR